MPRRVRPRSVTVTALAAAGLLSAANGALTGVGSAAPGPAVPPDTQASASVSVHCPFADPLGPRALTVETTATLPAQAKTGTSAKIGAYSVKLSLPRDVALSFLPAGATTGSLRGTVQLDLAVHQDDRSDKVPVSLVVAPTPLPETGDVVLTATGTVPEIAINTIGAVTFDVTAPTLTLDAVPAPDAPPATTAPPKVACTLDDGQKTTLGKVLVLPKVTPGTKQSAAPGGVTAMDDEPPPYIYTQPMGLVSVITNSTVKKLGATVVSTPSAIVNGYINVNVDTGYAWITGSTAFSPVTATFLGFGFVPVSATVEFLPLDYQNSRMIAVTGNLYTDEVTGLASMRATVEVKARMSHAEINGVPLDLGPDCVTKDPVTLKVSGPYDPFDPTGEGIVDTKEAGGFTLPGFAGCGSGGQDLNPLLEGMSSGDGNQATVYLYNLAGCMTPDPADCPPHTNPPPPGSQTAAAAAKKAATKPR